MEDILQAAGGRRGDHHRPLRPPGRRRPDGRRRARRRRRRATAAASPCPTCYITDGSVLPTQGSANPALTIMAVAARAADPLSAGTAATSSLVDLRRGVEDGDERPGRRRDAHRPGLHHPDRRPRGRRDDRVDLDDHGRRRSPAEGDVGPGVDLRSRCAAMVIDELASRGHRSDAMDIGGHSTAMVKAVRNAGRPGVAGCAISAVDIALWDLKARLLDLPLHRAARRRPRRRARVRQRRLHHLRRGPARRAARALGARAGHSPRQDQDRRVLGHRPGRDLDRMRQARAVVGDDTELFVDANGGYTRKQAIRVMSGRNDLDVRWFEEPVSSDDLDGLRGSPGRRVRRRRRPVNTATTCTTSAGCARPAPSTACKPTSTRCGGITEWLRVAAVAASFGLKSPATAGHTCTPTSPPRRPTCATSSGSTTTFGSRTCSSTAPSTRREGSSLRTPPPPEMGSLSKPQMPSPSGSSRPQD